MLYHIFDSCNFVQICCCCNASMLLLLYKLLQCRCCCAVPAGMRAGCQPNETRDERPPTAPWASAALCARVSAHLRTSSAIVSAAERGSPLSRCRLMVIVAVMGTEFGGVKGGSRGGGGLGGGGGAGGGAGAPYSSTTHRGGMATTRQPISSAVLRLPISTGCALSAEHMRKFERSNVRLVLHRIAL